MPDKISAGGFSVTTLTATPTVLLIYYNNIPVRSKAYIHIIVAEFKQF